MNRIDRLVAGIERDLESFEDISDQAEMDNLRDRINGLVLSLAPAYFKVSDGKNVLKERLATLKPCPETFQLFLENSKEFVKVRNLADRAFGYAQRFHERLCDRLQDMIDDLENGPTKEQSDQIDQLFDKISGDGQTYYEILSILSDKIAKRWENDPNNNFLKFLFDEMHERLMSHSTHRGEDHTRLVDHLCRTADRIIQTRS
ncbi:MAG: hypothetical protein K1X28_04300 [Parachlamydiales bacterium]|nr:hypothetical protein [Parachlamydiales bacterium]